MNYMSTEKENKLNETLVIRKLHIPHIPNLQTDLGQLFPDSCAQFGLHIETVIAGPAHQLI